MRIQLSVDQYQNVNCSSFSGPMNIEMGTVTDRRTFRVGTEDFAPHSGSHLLDLSFVESPEVEKNGGDVDTGFTRCKNKRKLFMRLGRRLRQPIVSILSLVTIVIILGFITLRVGIY